MFHATNPNCLGRMVVLVCAMALPCEQGWMCSWMSAPRGMRQERISLIWAPLITERSRRIRATGACPSPRLQSPCAARGEAPAALAGDRGSIWMSCHIIHKIFLKKLRNWKSLQITVFLSWCPACGQDVLQDGNKPGRGGDGGNYSATSQPPVLFTETESSLEEYEFVEMEHCSAIWL